MRPIPSRRDSSMLNTALKRCLFVQKSLRRRPTCWSLSVLLIRAQDFRRTFRIRAHARSLLNRGLTAMSSSALTFHLLLNAFVDVSREAALGSLKCKNCANDLSMTLWRRRARILRNGGHTYRDIWRFSTTLGRWWNREYWSFSLGASIYEPQAWSWRMLIEPELWKQPTSHQSDGPRRPSSRLLSFSNCSGKCTSGPLKRRSFVR
jgi:hypothetical protein